MEKLGNNPDGRKKITKKRQTRKHSNVMQNRKKSKQVQADGKGKWNMKRQAETHTKNCGETKI